MIQTSAQYFAVDDKREVQSDRLRVAITGEGEFQVYVRGPGQFAYLNTDELRCLRDWISSVLEKERERERA